jgi:DNA primase catalytic core
MGRNDDAIKRIKDIPIVEVVESYGIKLQGIGRLFRGLCQFHEEKNPSFTVYPDNNSFHCFGCGAGGSVIDFVMLIDKIDFWSAVKKLAPLAGITLEPPTPEEQKAIDESRIIDQVRAETAAFYEKSLTPEFELRLASQRKWTSETIKKFRIGFANGGLAKHLLEDCKFPLELCIKAGVLKQAGDGEVKDYFYNREIFPNVSRGSVGHLTGRTVNGNPIKWLHIPGEKPPLVNEDALRNPRVFFGEGFPDGITSEQYGMPAVAIYGKQFKPEWAEKFSRCEKVYIGIHLHEQGTPELAIRIAEALGDKARIVVIPGDQDLNDYMKEHTQEDFNRLLADAPDGIRYELGLIPLNLDKVELSQRIKPLLEKLSRRDEAAIEAYLTVIHDKFKDSVGLTKDDIKAYRKLVTQYRKAGTEDEDKTVLPQEIVWEEPEIIGPAQDFLGGKAYFSVWLSFRIDGVVTRLPYIISSTGERIHLNPQDPRELQRHGFRLKNKDQIPTDSPRWSLKKDVPNSVYDFLNGEAEVDPVELFNQIRSLVETYLDLPDPRYYILLPLWCIGTYCFMLFDSYPYIYLNATKRSGKTRTIEIAGPICFNGIISASVSDASMYRSVETDRCVFFCDEAEKFKGKNPKDMSERLEIFNSGYKKSGSVRRCEGDNHIPRDFSTYSPKLLANIDGLDSTAADRTLVLRLLRAKKRIPKYMHRKLSPVFQAIRNALYVLIMQHHQEIYDIYSKMDEDDRLKDREEELWGPMLTIAEFIDRHRLIKDPSLPAGELYFEKMFSLAMDSQRHKMEDEEEENPDIKILIGVIDFIKNPDNLPLLDESDQPTELYSADDLCRVLQDLLGWEKLSKYHVGRVMKKLQVIKGKEDKQYVHTGTGNAKKPLYYRLRRSVIADIATRYGLRDMVAGFLEEKDRRPDLRPESRPSEEAEPSAQQGDLEL